GGAFLTTAVCLSCYGTLEGYLTCADAKNINKELFKFKTPSGIIGNVFTYEHKGKQYLGVVSGIGGWAGIGMGAGPEQDTDGRGALGRDPAAALSRAAAAVAGQDTPPYKVVDGYKVDAFTLTGFRTWRAAACDRCHGANQEGMVGPSVLASLKLLTNDE